MRFTLLNNVYDDGGNEKIRKFFEKAVRWITEANLASKRNWHKILSQRYGQYLIEGGSDNTLLESQCEGCGGECSSCYIKKDKGEVKMSVSLLDKRIDEAFGPYQRPESEENLGFAMIHQIDKNGELKQTPHSQLDETIYWEEQRKEERLEESGNLSDDEKILAAFK